MLRPTSNLSPPRETVAIPKRVRDDEKFGFSRKERDIWFLKKLYNGEDHDGKPSISPLANRHNGLVGRRRGGVACSQWTQENGLKFSISSISHHE